MKWIATIAVLAALGATGAAWADNHQEKPDRTDPRGMMRDGMMRGGMMQGGMMQGGMMSMMMSMMMGNSAGMADACAGMMRDTNSGKPNQQWRKDR